MTKIGLSIVLGATVAAAIGPWVVPFDPAIQFLEHRLSGPSLLHPFGLDELGRDILARVLSGARVSLFVGIDIESFI